LETSKASPEDDLERFQEMSVIASALNTRHGRRFRRHLDAFLARHPKEWTSAGMKLTLNCATDWSCRNALGYSDWCISEPVHFFCDLGCNTGLFSLWLEAQQRHGLKGLAVDANVEMVNQCRHNFLQNALTGMVVVHGMVGEDEGVAFHPHAIHVLSSAIKLSQATGEYLGSTCHPPTVNASKLWAEHFDQPPDLLKVDIEGSEWGFIRNGDEWYLLTESKRILIEWHEPLMTLTTLRESLPYYRLEEYQVHGWIGLAYFRKT
jgi:FkbM family methyltransferase